MTERFISVAEVLDRVGFSRTHLYRKINAGSFPRPVPLGPQKVAFLESEILRWMDERLDPSQPQKLRTGCVTLYTNHAL